MSACLAAPDKQIQAINQMRLAHPSQFCLSEMQRLPEAWRLGALPEEALLIGFIGGVGVGEVSTQDEHIRTGKSLRAVHMVRGDEPRRHRRGWNIFECATPAFSRCNTGILGGEP